MNEDPALAELYLKATGDADGVVEQNGQCLGLDHLILLKLLISHFFGNKKRIQNIRKKAG